MKKTAYLLVAIVLVSAVPVFAQGPFTDVPTDHWAYDAVNTLQKDGVLIGYPDGTFGGKRTITRFEFAVAIARVIGMINPTQNIDTSKFATKEDLDSAINALKSQLPTIPANLATKADVDALRKLIDEFRDELAALGVDVDALKRDVAALCARVDALEAEAKRIRITGDATVFAIAESSREGVTVDQDERISSPAQKNDTLLRNVGLVKDFDLNIVGRVTDKTTANATINYGNYLNYLAFVDDYVDGPRPTSTTPAKAVGNDNPNADSLADSFFPYYANIQSALGRGNLVVGRLPLQFTPYTLKKVDVDTYTNILKTDDGNYPVDGAKLGLNYGFADITLFAAKNDENLYLAHGLTSLTTAGINDPALRKAGLLPAGQTTVHQLTTGHAVGGLDTISQSAGARVVAGIPWAGTIAGTYYQAWDQTAYNTPGSVFDQAQVYGADLSAVVPVLNGIAFNGSWTQSNTLTTKSPTRAIGSDVKSSNTAWDAKLGAAIGKYGVSVGYKEIGQNFAAAGYWDKIGRWTNPTDVHGPYGNLDIPILNNLKFAATGEWLKVTDSLRVAPGGLWGMADDTVSKAQAGVKWGFTKCNSLDVSYQWISYNPVTAGNAAALEQYLTVGLSNQLSATTGLSVGYQFIDYNDGPTHSGPYVGDYRGGLGVVQFGVTF